jgi:hypothetical protein
MEKPQAKFVAVGKTLQKPVKKLKKAQDMRKKPIYYKEEAIQGLAQQKKGTQVQKRYYEDPIDSHKQKYDINFQNKLCCDYKH